MNTDKSFIQRYKAFSPLSRVWVYKSNRFFSQKEVKEIQEKLNSFTEKWHAHDRQLKAVAELIYHSVIVIMVDEEQVSASGCSIDKSVHFIKNLSSQYSFNVYDRSKILFIKNNTPYWLTFQKAIDIKPKQVVNENISSFKEFKTDFFIPFEESQFPLLASSNTFKGKLLQNIFPFLSLALQYPAIMAAV